MSSNNDEEEIRSPTTAGQQTPSLRQVVGVCPSHSRPPSEFGEAVPPPSTSSSQLSGQHAQQAQSSSSQASAGGSGATLAEPWCEGVSQSLSNLGVGAVARSTNMDNHPLSDVNQDQATERRLNERLTGEQVIKVDTVHIGDQHVTTFTGPITIIQHISTLESQITLTPRCVELVEETAETVPKLTDPSRNPNPPLNPVGATPPSGPRSGTTMPETEPFTSQEPASNIHDKCEELKLLLKDQAHMTASEESSLAEFSERPFSPVNLSIVSKPRQIEDEFQSTGQHRRHGGAVASPSRGSDITSEQLFARSKEAANHEARRKFQPHQELAKRKYVEVHGNIVGVVGLPGIGKTTSAKKWVMQALNRDLFGKLSYFFFVVIRYLDFTETMTLLQFLLSAILPEWLCTPDQAKHIHNIINNDPDVVLIFDGLDEAQFDSFEKSVRGPSLHSKSKAENFLKHLAAGNLLPRARKIFLSRPAKMYKLHHWYRPKFMVEILGLTPTSQDQLGRQICGDRYGLIKERLRQNNDRFDFCFIPVNFILTLNYLMNYRGDIQFVSLTRVLTFTCVRYSETEHLGSYECQFDKLAKMAWDGFKANKVVYKFSDIQEAGIDKPAADAFLNTSVTERGNLKLKILDGHKRIYFSHLIWHEFFAAVYLMMIMPLVSFKSYVSQLTEDRFQVVSNFVFGILDPIAFAELDSIIPGCSRDDWNARKSTLKDFLRSYMRKQTNSKLMQACRWVNEAKDADLTGFVSSLLHGEIDISDNSYPRTDIENLFVVLQVDRFTSLRRLDLTSNKIQEWGAASLALCIRYIEELILVQCDISVEGVRKLTEKIAALTKPLRKLDLSRNRRIGDQGATVLACCLRNIEALLLCDCEVAGVGVEALATTIQTLPKPMKLLDLFMSKIGNAGARSLARCIHNIEMLLLRQCEIGNAGVDELASRIQTLPNPLKKLNLTRNKIGNVGAMSLSRCIHNIEILTLKFCDIKSQGVEKLAEKIQSSLRPMKELDLSRNEIQDVGAAFLSRCVRNVEKLYLRDCGIENFGIEELANTIKTLLTSMRKVDFSFNQFGASAVKALGSCVHNIEELVLESCGIENDGLQWLTKGIQALRTPMRKLVLSNNDNLGDFGANLVANCIHNIEQLDMRDCEIESIGLLSEKIQRLQQPLWLLDLSCNNISDLGARSLATCIHKIRHLNLMYCGIKNNGAVELATRIKVLDSPMESLDLCGNYQLGDECAESLAECLHNLKSFNLQWCVFSDEGKHLLQSRCQGDLQL